jgi:hypothetical protein
LRLRTHIHVLGNLKTEELKMCSRGRGVSPLLKNFFLLFSFPHIENMPVAGGQLVFQFLGSCRGG